MKVRSEMDGDGDGFRSERLRVREKMEGDRALQRVMGSKCVRKKKKRRLYNKTSPKKSVLWLCVLNAA